MGEQRNPALPARATATDARALAALAARAQPGGWPGWSEPSFREELADGGALAWIARESDPAAAARAGLVARVLAAAAARATAAGRAGEIELRWLAVRPDARRRGLAAALVDALLAEAARRRSHVLLEVRASNAPATALYASRGFVVAGRRARYYRDGEDALVLRRDAESP